MSGNLCYLLNSSCIYLQDTLEICTILHCKSLFIGMDVDVHKKSMKNSYFGDKTYPAKNFYGLSA